jgi:tryptophanyl-tRNA synthetase
MRIVTDSTPVADPKDPDKCTVFGLYSLLASESERADLRKRYVGGGLAYGEAKQLLFDKYWEYFRTFRDRRRELLADRAYVESVLTRGAERARTAAAATVNAVKRAVGLR